MFLSVTQPPPVAMETARSGAATPSMFSSVSHVTGRHLLQRLANTTLNHIRRMGKVDAAPDEESFKDVKLNLNSQLTEAEDDERLLSQNTKSTLKLYQLPHSTATTTWSDVVVPRSEQRVMTLHDVLPKDQFYEVESELCDLLGGHVTRCIGGRGHTRSPVANLLDNAYFIPVKIN